MLLLLFIISSLLLPLLFVDVVVFKKKKKKDIVIRPQRVIHRCICFRSAATRCCIVGHTDKAHSRKKVFVCYFQVKSRLFIKDNNFEGLTHRCQNKNVVSEKCITRLKMFKFSIYTNIFLRIYTITCVINY